MRRLIFGLTIILTLGQLGARDMKHANFDLDDHTRGKYKKTQDINIKPLAQWEKENTQLYIIDVDFLENGEILEKHPGGEQVLNARDFIAIKNAKGEVLIKKNDGEIILIDKKDLKNKPQKTIK